MESLQALASLADDLAARPQARLPELVADLAERAWLSKHAPTVQGVTLASLHLAKGLEWDVVHLVGCCAAGCRPRPSRWPETGGHRGGAAAVLRRGRPSGHRSAGPPPATSAVGRHGARRASSTTP
ncbi:hypothetical protein [Arsenicicoccus piscis]|uniref:hypothetical protein n=1 Tax=Arsenicicoccus piscis TaxID=673954 RepID=UPI003B98034B